MDGSISAKGLCEYNNIGFSIVNQKDVKTTALFFCW